MENQCDDFPCLFRYTLDSSPMGSICSWHIVLPFTACHWLLIGPKCGVYGFDGITGGHQKLLLQNALRAKGLWGLGIGAVWHLLASRSWKTVFFLGPLGIGYFLFKSPVDFTRVSVKPSLNRDIKGCTEKGKTENTNVFQGDAAGSSCYCILKSHLF